MQLDAKQLRFCIINNQVIPDEGPKAIPVILDFSATGSNGQPIDIDLSGIIDQTRITMIQTLFVDCANSANDVKITAGVSGQQIVAKTKTQGYYNILAPNPLTLRFESLGGGLINLPVYLINVPIPGVVWPVS